ncbi:MAG: hypothetical protein AUK44_05445 [Porphyromonadaceae bacterium CG2_30_38_12]|nr:MAG: hypothetical protein AUK44_05445 [Porphyromonadaceae bacterium CG2_30_38_12]
MWFRKVSTISLFIFSLFTAIAAEKAASYKLYGSVRSDFYYNSRQNVQAQDGLFNIMPKPILLINGKDVNAIAEVEMLSVYTRLGLDFNGTPVLGATTTAKIEFDFAGISTSYYLIRLRQAYIKFNTASGELSVGQTWHPLFGSVMPTIISSNAGAAFQPFNRSPQIRFKKNVTQNSALVLAAIYQMQYLSQGPNGASASYLKRSLLPNIFVGWERKTPTWTQGMGFDTKTLKINNENLTSASAMAYAQYSSKKWQVKGKAILGENLSDHLIMGGYGVVGKNSATGDDTYTNFNTMTSWLNVVYGSKIQYGIFLGLSQNLGTNNMLIPNAASIITAYGYGFDVKSQEIIDKMYRVSSHISYNLPNFRAGIEYELTSADFGTIKNTGRALNPYRVINHRIQAMVSYNF